MSQVVWQRAPSLRRPILLLAFEGWFDAGECATGAVQWLADRYDAQPVAQIDPEEFFDFQENRPESVINDEGKRSIEWPTNEVLLAETSSPHDLLLLAGVEPRLRWRTFCESVHEIIRDTSTELVITLGSLVSSVPHTRAAPIQGSASDVALAGRLGLSRPSYQGPTGIVGTLTDTLDRAGVPVMSLRASVPHYVSGPSNPKGQQALLRRLDEALSVRTGADELDSDVREWEARVTDAVSIDDEVVEYVRRLESEVDRQADQTMISGDELAEEIQRFLRERDD